MNKFTWDESKRLANIVKHGLDFIIAVELFDGRGMISAQSPRDEEMRFVSVCEWRSRYIAVIWTWRSDARRIISIRRARDVEKKAYEDVFGG